MFILHSCIIMHYSFHAYIGTLVVKQDAGQEEALEYILMHTCILIRETSLFNHGTCLIETFLYLHYSLNLPTERRVLHTQGSVKATCVNCEGNSFWGAWSAVFLVMSYHCLLLSSFSCPGQLLGCFISVKCKLQQHASIF